MQIEHVRTSTSDGLVFVGQLFSRAENKHIILHIHGMGGSLYSNSFYPYMQKYYPLSGFDFLVVEHRGTHSVTSFDVNDGGVKIVGNAYEKFEDSFYDIDAWLREILKMGYRSIVLQAHSLGPSKIVYYYLNSDDRKRRYIKAMVLLSPVDVLGASRQDKNYKFLLSEARKLIEKGKGEALLNKNLGGEYKLSAKTFLDFFGGEESDANIFPYHNPNSPLWRRFSKITIPLVAFTGTQDVIPSPYEAMSLLKEKLVNSPKVETVVYEGAAHDFKGFGRKLAEKTVSFLQNLD